jgi:hypothetical protein
MLFAESFTYRHQLFGEKAHPAPNAVETQTLRVSSIGLRLWQSELASL